MTTSKALIIGTGVLIALLIALTAGQSYDAYKAKRKSEDQLGALRAQWAYRRAEVIATAKEHFVASRPAEAAAAIAPFLAVADREAMLIYELAKPQADLEQRRQEVAAAAARKAADARDAEAKAANAKKADEACRLDRQCWGDRYMVEASSVCRAPIEAQAKFNFEWTDGWLEGKFDKFIVAGRAITYLGDKIKFQNGFGAWTKMKYSCNFDPKTKEVRVLVESR